jgi:peroxiredoxin
MKVYVILLCSWVLSGAICNGQDCDDNVFETLEKLKKAGIKFPYTNTYALESFLGCSFPDFKARTIKGDSVSLKKLKGKVIVMNFWFEGCPPCIAEMPSLNKLVDEFSGSEVVFIAWSRDNSDSVKKFLKQKPFKYQQIADASYFAKKHGVDLGGWPVNIIIDKKGIVRYIRSGGPPEDSDYSDNNYYLLRPFISACLKGRF